MKIGKEGRKEGEAEYSEDKTFMEIKREEGSLFLSLFSVSQSIIPRELSLSFSSAIICKFSRAGVLNFPSLSPGFSRQ